MNPWGSCAQAPAAALDSLLEACDAKADALAGRVAFGADTLTAGDIRQALIAARDTADPNTATAAGEDGDTAEFVFSVLISLRSLLQRACAQSARVAVFTWAPE